MTEKDFLIKFDNLLKAHDLDGAKSFGEDSLNEAIKDGNTSLIITVLNELIGFYRDLGLNEESYKMSCALERLIKPIENPYLHFISYINIGNSHRASSHYNEAHIAFENALKIYEENNFNSLKEHAALYNNLALLNQCENNYEEAILNLNRALDIIKNIDDEIKLGTTYVNISQCYIKLNSLDIAYDYINKAKSIFDNHKDDFHIMGYYNTLAKIYYLNKEYNLSEQFYLSALASTAKFVGYGNQYNEILDEYKIVLAKLNKTRTKGLDLAYNYYNDFKDILFNGIEEQTKSSLTVGLFGLGSECYGMDDYISEDHDFNPGFIVLCEDNIPESEFIKLKNNYNSLPREYNRFYIKDILLKHGVHRLNDYLFEYLGIEDIKNISSQSKSLLLNGKLFYKGYDSTFNHLRMDVLSKDKHEYLRNIALKTLEISQYIPYNLKRAKDRKENDTYQILKNHLIDKLIEYYYIYHHKYFPHDKLSLKMMDKTSVIYKWILSIMEDEILDVEINHLLTNNLFKLHIIKNMNSLYIDDYKEEIIEFVKLDIYKSRIIPKMVEIEWEMFEELQNIGGRASCQNNKPMFCLMRESQYYAWNRELLDSYYNDLKEAKNNKYNILAIKYGFMEESVDPLHYESIKVGLPSLDEKRIALREGIVDVQLEMLEEYSKYNDISNMRTINTVTDKYNNASYETYLRGELSSYSENTMYLYAKYISSLAKAKINLVELTLFYTNLFK